MYIIPILLAFSMVVLPSLSQDTWPLSPLNITEFNSLGLITLTPLTTTGPALTLATPTGVANPHVASSCTAAPWTIRQVAAFTADPTDEVIDYSHIEFYFNDPNAGLESYCERDLPPGSGQSPIDKDHWYPCYNFGMSFLYAGTTMGLRRNFECGGHTITAQGQAPLELQCRPMFNGTICTNVADIEVPISTVVG